MRALLVFSAVFLSAILFGALVAFPVYEIFSSFGEITFRKTVSRTTLLSGLLFSLVYFTRYNGLSLARLGLTAQRAHTRLFQGLAAGLVIVAMIEANLLLLGVHAFHAERLLALDQLSPLLFKWLVTGLLVGLVEEVIFRGALLGGLSRQTNQALALVVVSLVYAAVHYLKFRDLPADAIITWHTGVAMIPSALFQFADPARYDAMLSLFFLGLLLGLVRVFSGSLVLCIGVHAGVIVGEKLIQHMTDFVPHSAHAHLVNRYDPFVGDLASAWLLVFCVSFYFIYRRRLRQSR